MTCLGCFGGKRVAGIAQTTHPCFRCKGSGVEPKIDQDFVNAINARIRGVK